ncbi:MAG: peptidoglycan-associated lipoprotein [Deltaproteobacteria bacterium]|nr:MAG: peptidoglycan-associated lipoprotein [Deltaproteobacteria bacterium]
MFGRSIRLALPALLLASVVTFSGCASSDDKDKEVKPAKTNEAVGEPEPLESESIGILEGRTDGPMLPVYFDFDSSEIKGDGVMRIENNADFIKEKGVSIIIEGNCDDRGTNEYNMALGERRALAAKKYLVNLGVDPAKLTTVSYGEERTHIIGHNEKAWSQNRRDDFVIAK